MIIGRRRKTPIRPLTLHGPRRTPLAATSVATALFLLVAACVSRLADAFTSIAAQTHQRQHYLALRCQRTCSWPTRYLGTRKVAQRDGRWSMMAGKKRGKRVPKPEPVGAGGKQGNRVVSGSGLVSWEKEYKAYIKRTGQYLCSMSWEGYEEMGRGAIFANYDDARADGKLNDAEKFGGIPSMYIPLKEFESMRAADRPGEDEDLAQIVKRIDTYRPETEFVVVFQAAGVMGTDVVRPNISPPDMAKYVVKQNQPPARDDGVIDVAPIED